MSAWSYRRWIGCGLKLTFRLRQTLPARVEGGEDDKIAVEGREGTSIPGGGEDDASDSDDLEVTWEVDSPESARDVGVASSHAEDSRETGMPRIRLTSPMAVMAKRSISAFFYRCTTFWLASLSKMLSTQRVRIAKLSRP